MRNAARFLLSVILPASISEQKLAAAISGWICEIQDRAHTASRTMSAYSKARGDGAPQSSASRVLAVRGERSERRFG